MATNKKPSKKYNPERRHRERQMAKLLAQPAEAVQDWHTELLIKNHGAMTALTQGRATRADMVILTAMHNMIEALWRMGFATEYEGVIIGGYQALTAAVRRGVKNGDRFILTGPELNALNLHMELHDELMRVATVRDVEAALALIKRHHKEGKTDRVVDFIEGHAV